MTIVPPIKSQGIKTKLASWILDCIKNKKFERWVEPFSGTCAVAFNIAPKYALLCDSNPHIIEFYKSIQRKEITAAKTKNFLYNEGKELLRTNGEYYYTVRERFNLKGDPLDFLFLSRSCFNGMVRFNKRGGYNVPFCKKPNRFAQALITRICNQIDSVAYIIEVNDYTFKNQDFLDTISETSTHDLIYCDPPYIGRHVDYYDSWSIEEEKALYNVLINSKSDFILSTWEQNKYRINEHINLIWKNCSKVTKEHFYHVGAKENNRNAITEALLANFPLKQLSHPTYFNNYPQFNLLFSDLSCG